MKRTYRQTDTNKQQQEAVATNMFQTCVHYRGKLYDVLYFLKMSKVDEIELFINRKDAPK
jgi:hypothetical protein